MAALRNQMLSLIAAAVAFALLLGGIAWQANVVTHDAYHALVDQGAVSVDAALQARAAALDQMGAAATYLATGDANAKAFADQRWADFNEQARVSWRNLSDATQGEFNVYRAADDAASDYIQQIGAMYAYYDAKQPTQAATAFLAARDTLNTRLIPALNGLEAVKVEHMDATYAQANGRIMAWRWSVIGLGALLTLILLGGLWAVRRMHYAWSWSIGIALLLTLGLTWFMQDQALRAAEDARIMVRDAYDTVAGVQDLQALLSQERALESIAIFDPTHATTHLSSFNDYNFLVEQKLCGDTGCTQNPFTDGSDNVDPTVRRAALDAQAKFGLPRSPLIANVPAGNASFAGEATQFEKLRTDYRHWLDLHGQLASQLTANQVDAARTLSTHDLDAAFRQVVADVDAVRATARKPFNDIANRVLTITDVNQALAVVFPLAGLLAAYGVWRRRSELFV